MHYIYFFSPYIITKSNTKTNLTRNPRSLEFPFHHLVQRSYPKQPSNPCVPTPCGHGTTCTVNAAGNAICNCQPGLIPKPDTIAGCGPECTRDSDCKRGFVCEQAWQRCVEKPDPCNPSPCGPGSRCMEDNNGNAICRFYEIFQKFPLIMAWKFKAISFCMIHSLLLVVHEALLL